MNPLSLFRKYQKTMLAIAAVGAMLAFGVLPILSDWMGQRGRVAGDGAVDANAVAVSWKGGELRERELQSKQILRTQMRIFQQAVLQLAAQRGATPRSVVVPDTSSEASVVESMVLASIAEDMGIRVGDDAVLQYLVSHLSNDTLSGNGLAALLKESTGGRLSQVQLFDGLRTELAAHQVRVLANGAVFNGSLADTSVTPGQAYEYFKRLYRRMEAEVLPFPVEDYIERVQEEPTEAEIAELYEEYKEVYPSPITPTPGFRQPMQAAFQWVKADFPTFLEAEIAKITDEEIQKYYEENKESYRKLSLPDMGALETENDQPLGDLPINESEGTTEPAATEPATFEDAGEVETPADAAETEEAASSDVIDAGEGQDELSEADDDVAAATDSADDAAQTEEAAPADDTVADETTDADTVTDEQETVVEDATSEADSTAETDSTAEPAAEPEVEYQPLEEVRDDIARTLARPKATEAIRNAVQEVSSTMSSYFEDFMFWDVSLESERGEKPAAPDLAATAKQLGMVYGEIPLINALQTEDYELGRAFELDFSTGQIRRLPFTQMAFDPSLSKFDPQTISASDVDSQFVFWKTDETAARVPELSEARPEIIRYWKMKKAIAIAKAEAEKVASEVRDASQSLQTKFAESPDTVVADTGQFTWMTFGATATGQGPPRISFVEGVEFPGDEFMRDVSKLESGELCVTQNYPESTVYLVYMKGVTGSDENLRTLFLNEGLKQPVLYMARQDNMRAAADWYLAREKELDLTWQRAPVSGP